MKSITDEIRNHIQSSGESQASIAKGAGVPQPMIWRFMQGFDIRLATADKLAAYFDLELAPRKPDKPPRKKP